mgnify:CR=1 FL=1
MVGTSFLRRVWSPACQRVHNFLAAYKALDAWFRYYKYKVGPGSGAANCRQITGGSGYSLHAYFGTLAFVFWNVFRIPLMALAVDINPGRNPYSRRLITDMPRPMVDAISRVRTKSGHQVWQWGGYFSTYKDSMHFEICCTPAQLRTGIDPRTLPGVPIPTTPVQGANEMIRIQWYRGDPTAAGDNPDIDAAYEVTSFRTKDGREVDQDARWIKDLTALNKKRMLYGGVEKQTRISPATARGQNVRFHGGPFQTIGTW